VPEYFKYDACSTPTPIELDDFLEACDSNMNPLNEDTILSQRAGLVALGKNKQFIIDHLRQRLENPALWHVDDTPVMYSDQSIILARRDNYYIRVASWYPPSRKHGSFSWDNDFFSYNFAHNHAFTLLSTGLYGPGYTSDNYSLRIPPGFLNVDQPVPLYSEPSFTLAEGDAVLFRKWYDVHDQKPPTAFSLSLNLLVFDPLLPQYGFDVSRSVALNQIDGPGYRLSILLDLAQRFLGEESQEILRWVCDHGVASHTIQAQIKRFLKTVDHQTAT
jgi:hypothetical protein